MNISNVQFDLAFYFTTTFRQSPVSQHELKFSANINTKPLRFRSKMSGGFEQLAVLLSPLSGNAEHMNEVAASPTDINLVLRLQDADHQYIKAVIGKYGLSLIQVAEEAPIPGSFWGDEEAGLIGNEIFARADTPVHSVLHETCHFICMDQARRDGIHTNAGGDYDEENAVCYLQILLSEDIEGMSRQRMFDDMDHWGYSFRLGSARKWFEQDAEDALQWLLKYGLLDSLHQPNGQLRKET